VNERRQLPRLRLRRKVWLQWAGGHIAELWTHDLSGAGLQVLSPVRADEGDEFNLLLKVPDHDDTFVDVQARVQVVHCVYDSSAGQFRTGMRFLAFSGEGETLYRQYLDHQLHCRYESRSRRSLVLR